jgi:hypothetical protein
MPSILVEAVTDFMSGNTPKPTEIEEIQVIWIFAIREECRRLQDASGEDNLQLDHEKTKRTSLPGGL